MIQQERGIEIFCDIHGHYCPAGDFMYCNSYDSSELNFNHSNVDREKLTDNAQLRVIPHLLAKKNKHFDIKQCTFTMEQYKAASARQVFFNEFKIKHSFTLENSFFKKQGNDLSLSNL